MRQTARGIASYELSKDDARILVPLSGRLFVIERRSREIIELASDQGFPLDPHFSPDGAQVGCVRDGDLFVIDVATRQERRLTTRSGPDITNGLSEFVAQEEMDRFSGYWWSPDSRALAYQQTDTAGMEIMHIADVAHPEQPAQTWPYPRPGQKNASVKLGVISADGGETIWVTWDQQRYPYLATVRWDEHAPLTLVVQNRAQTESAVLEVDPARGQTTMLHVETDPAWLNLDQDVPRWLPDGSGFLWTTERSGQWQLELRARNGDPIRTLTPLNFGYRGLISMDDSGQEAIVYASVDPTQRQIYRITLDGRQTAPVRMSDGAGNHGAIYSRDHRVSVHSLENLEGRSQHTVQRGDGSTIGALTSVADTPPFLPHVELTTVRAGDTGFHAAIVRPRDFHPRRRYPVIEYVYGGPHGTVVSGSGYGYLLNQWLADQGFIIVRLDGRGTPNRGREWERAILGNFIAVPLADHVAGLQALGQRYRELDLSRVGITGWSFGGYFTAMAVMQRPDIYRAGVAGAPVTDWLDYDTHYTERYLRLPDENPAGYRESSVLTYASGLTRPLLIVHGTTDDNVYFMHSLKLSEALFRAGRPHDFLPLANFTHMVADPHATAQLNQRIADYFIEHLVRSREQRNAAVQH
jgi:dipeptidyl-peptidase-4